MEKVLTISIAAYNVENYIEKALNSLVIKDMDLLEVLIINDGSKDNTAKIAEQYEKKYPQTFRVINKLNGGYGSTINVGIQNAKGKFFKQLDGDDWYDTDSLNEICNMLKNVECDIVYTPFYEYYEKDGSTNLKNSFLNKHIQTENIEDVIRESSRKLEMHSLMYKLQLLKENNIKIEENCFYTDTEYALYPFMYAKTMKVIDIPLYMYRIGREGQSVSIEGIRKHFKDYLRVDKNLLECINKMEDTGENTRKYIINYIMTVLSLDLGKHFMVLVPNKKNKEMIKKFDEDIYNSNKDIYYEMERYSKTVKLLRKSKFILYRPISVCKRINKGE